MKLRQTKVATLAATLITLGSLAGGANAAILYTVNNGQTNLSGGVVVWDVADGLSTGSLTLTSVSSPNILTAGVSAGGASYQFSYDPAILSEYDLVFQATSGSSDSGNASFTVEETFGSTFYWETNSSFVTGNADYGQPPNNSLNLNDSGTGVANSFRVDLGSADFTVEGNGAYGWNLSFVTGEPGTNSVTITGNLSQIPEPSASLFIAFGGVVLLAGRKRN